MKKNETKKLERTLLEAQFIATILWSVKLLDVVSTDRIKHGPGKAFLSKWLKRPNAFYDSPRLGGVISKLVDVGALRCCGYQSQTPLYTFGDRFDEELELAFDIIYSDESVAIDDGELTINTDVIYIPLETLHEYFIELGYYDMQIEFY